MKVKINKLPLILSSKVIVYPEFRQTFDIGKEESLLALETAIKNKGQLLITPRLDKAIYQYDHSSVATLVIIDNVSEPDENGVVEVKVSGLKRVELSNVKHNGKYFESEFTLLKEIARKTKPTQDSKQKLLDLFKVSINDLNLPINAEEIKKFNNATPKHLADAFAHLVLVDFDTKLYVLQSNNVNERLQHIITNLENSKIDKSQQRQVNDINEKVKNKLNKQQREFYLKEQLKVIQEELNEINGDTSEIEQWKKKVSSKPYPKHIKEKLLKEIKKLENTPSQAAEANVIRQYIETLIELPFWEKTKEVIDIKRAKEQLDKDHYGLKKPKERIVEYLAVKKNNIDLKGPILSFVGPPGTGKTTLAKSIADALDRKFVKISLGGVKDEAEIRGHRRTYIASMPGKIMTAMKKAGVINPVILLDEIDKMSADFKGDPTSAMLEVLDYEQNKNFQDHYIEEDYDLSNVMFLATANYYNQIPEALIDRLEIVELSSYSELEKIEIAKSHLIPGVINDTKIAKQYFNWKDESIKFLIQHYTIEAGVRQLSRVINEVARKLIVKQLDSTLRKAVITPKLITELLGPEKFNFTKRENKPEIGTVMGLAWTQYGGDILPIEVVLYPGKGDLVLTGQLKDVMRESAGIALSFVKSNAEKLGIDLKHNGKNIFSDYDIHVHSPDGATPKDGPSAGITFTTALISTLIKKPVSQFIGMTGEITLRGKVLPIGGLKEKSISAYRSGLKKILIPKENIRDLIDIPKEVKENLEIIPVESYWNVYKEIFNI